MKALIIILIVLVLLGIVFGGAVAYFTVFKKEIEIVRPVILERHNYGDGILDYERIAWAKVRNVGKPGYIIIEAVFVQGDDMFTAKSKIWLNSNEDKKETFRCSQVTVGGGDVHVTITTYTEEEYSQLQTRRMLGH